MNNSPIEVYQPRAFSDHGVWDTCALQFKIDGLHVESKNIGVELISKAKQFVETEVLARVATMGECNGLGFIIIHPGNLGLTISAHWWVQGCILCQHNHRQLYGAVKPLDTLVRPVVACVWELAVINSEQEAWRQNMMGNTPDPAAYLKTRPLFQTV